ncbi:MAG: amino acid ABC transporter substrate-binding protein [Butyricicoccaceae bacterium]
MKKRFALLMAGAMMVSVLAAGCGSNGGKQQEGSASGSGTADKTTFTVGFDANFPPYGYKDENGEYVGFDLDLAAEVCERNGWELKKQPIEWSAKEMELSSGAIDCIWNGFTINGLEDKYCWSEPYVDNSQVFLIQKDSGIETFDDLAGKTVLVQKDSAALKALTDEEDHPDTAKLAKTFGDMIEIADYESAIMELEAGSADAIAIDIGVAKVKMAKNDKLAIMKDIITTEQYGIGFKLGNDALRDKVQNTLNEMVEDGTFTKIAEKWELTDAVCLGK